MIFKQYYNFYDKKFDLEKKSAIYIPKKKKYKPRLRNLTNSKKK